MVRSATFALLSLGIAVPAPAWAEQCPAHDTVVEYLAKEFSETPIALGVANNGGLIEVYTNPEGDTWTILLTYPDGQACMVAAGHGWENLPGAMASSEPGA